MMKRKTVFHKILAMLAMAALILGSIPVVSFAADTNIAPSGTPSTSYCSSWETVAALNDGYTPANSADHSHGAYGNWNNPGTTQWVQYSFSQKYTISKSEVYWFDDNQGLDLPASCNFQYWNGSAWVDFSNQTGRGVAANTFNVTTFTAVATDRIRLSITARSGYSTGILEWRVWGSPADTSGEPVVTAPPSWINSFYKKSVMINGIPICSTLAVPDQALKNAYYILEPYMRKIKAEKPAIIQKMNQNGVYVIIIGLNETNSMHPSWTGYNDPSWPRRGGGGLDTTVLEEDLIVPANDTWRQNFCGLVHEFSHTTLTYGIGDASRPGAEPATYNAIVTAYNHAIAANKYNESSYDRSNYHEYFCGQVNRWFNSNPTNLNVPNAGSKTDRQQLQEYDPEIYNILAGLFGDYKIPAPWN